MLPDEPTDEERQEELPEDNQTPFQPAAPSRDEAVEPDSDRQLEEDHVPDTHPQTDTNIQPEELYDEGVAGAAEISAPNAGNAVTGYPPPQTDGGDEEDEDEDVAIQPS